MFFASSAFVIIHVLISLVGIGTGLFVLYGLLKNEPMPRLTSIFLGFTLATSLTGFLFPFHKVTPGIVVGVVSCIILAVAYVALYRFRLEGIWRQGYLASAIAALWLNCFVFVAQAFQKVSFLHALAPNGNEPPFGIVQLLVLGGFVYAGYLAMKRFHPGIMTVVAGATRKAA